MEERKKGKSAKRLTYALLAAVLVVTLSSFCLLRGALGQSDQQCPAPEQAQGPTGAAAQEEAVGRTLAGRQVMDNFRLSLAMKEKMDFLLTPVFLVQESISDDAVLTYPEE